MGEQVQPPTIRTVESVALILRLEATVALQNASPLPMGTDLLCDTAYRRLWLSILLSAFGGQIAGIALPLTAAVLLQATPMQFGILGAMGTAPYILFSLPAGVWLDRVRKLPVYVAGETIMALLLASLTLIWALDLLSMSYLYGLSFATGCIGVISGTASQIVLTQLVPRERLIEAHARNALANSAADLAGPGVAGILIKLIGAPFALLANAALLLISVLMLRNLNTGEERLSRSTRNFWGALRQGIHYVISQRILVTLALTVAAWQVFQTAAMVVQVLFATRELGLSAIQFGLCCTGSGLGTITAGVIGHRLSRRAGPGPTLIAGLAISGLGWLQLAIAPSGNLGIASFVLMLICFSAGTVFIFSNMLAVRQTLTPPHMLARMTGIMRWITLFPAGPGAMLGGYIGEHFGLRHALGFGGAGALLLALVVWRYTAIPALTKLPTSSETESHPP